MVNSRNERFKIITRIISDDKVKNQSELLELLGEKGIGITQATLSRDLKMLNVAKMSDSNGSYFFLGSRPDSAVQSPESSFLSVEFSSSMAVIKTAPAYAQTIAAKIDSLRFFEVLGTIAGDDTVFLALKDGVNKNSLKKNIIDNLT